MNKWQELQLYVERKAEANPEIKAYQNVLDKMKWLDTPAEEVIERDAADIKAGKTFPQLCTEHGVKYGTFAYRYYSLGWTLEDALKPGSVKERYLSRSDKYEYMGETAHLAYFAKKYNLDYQLLYRRLIIHGWSISKAIETPPARRRPRNKD